MAKSSASGGTSPFKFGFFAGLGFLCAQFIFGLIAWVVIVTVGFGAIVAAIGSWGNSTKPATSLNAVAQPDERPAASEEPKPKDQHTRPAHSPQR